MFHAFRQGILLTWLGLAVVGFCASGCGTGNAAAVGRVTGAEARALVASGATLLDVRSREEYDARHIEGAVVIPVDELGSRLAEVPRDRPVVVYCQSGNRSARAARLLAEAGYEVHDLGGIGNW